VAFFPQLVAGPIERARNLLPQLSVRRAFPAGEQLRSGLLLILLGLFKKVAIADALAPTVDRAFDGAGSHGWIFLLVGLYAFAIQIYADFSGYTDIARGSARLLGIELMRNFDQPYLSRNITSFWRTWHMSLSSWLRDYLYIPLGGSARPGWRTRRNLMLTMLLGGLWHGAAWTFVVWGGLHGLFLAVDRGRRARTDLGGDPRPERRANAPFTTRDVLPALATFHLVCLAWIFFRADTFTAAWQYLSGILTLRAGPIDPPAVVLLAPAMAVMFLIDLGQRNAGDHTIMLRWPAAARGAFYAGCCVAVLLFSGQVQVPFIYFQF
jgi:alginate O-acetyltransferase complex protein AlgI